jgi:hypothetical protein
MVETLAQVEACVLETSSQGRAERGAVMTKLGKRLIKAADEALAMARGEATARQLNLFKGKRQRGQRVDVSPSEFQLQCEVADLLRRWAKPTWVFTHIPLGEYRTPATAARLQRMGVTAGFPDFIFLAPQGKGPFFLELKRKGGKLSEHQAGFALWCKLNGYPFEIADSFERALAVLQGWGTVRTGVKIQ